jgi:pimeloyl-ACP methyl ester carboxylesterase
LVTILYGAVGKLIARHENRFSRHLLIKAPYLFSSPHSGRRYQLFFLALIAITLTRCQAKSRNNNASQALPALTDCQLSSPGMPIRLPAECGEIQVFENRAEAQGRQIPIHFAVIPAVSRNPAPDPLFFITGGPGQAATESYPQISNAFDRIHQKRDIVLVDQRGTGKSNPLVCPAPQIDTAPEDLPDAKLSDWLKNCLGNLQADASLYTTPIAMQDLDEVRMTLGYEKINLYGVSYGTRAALTYLEAYPDRVRSVILDGVVPQDDRLGLTVGRDAQRALDLIFERCTQDIACNQKFPDLPEEFTHLLDQLKARPVDVTLTHPVSGEETQIRFTSEKVASAIRLFSYAPETAALLPLLIHNAYEHQAFATLASDYLIVSEELEGSIDNGMGYSVLCSEDVPFYTLQEAQNINADSYLGNVVAEELFHVCQVWPHGSVPADYKKPVRSNVPVLLLSGEADPVTPPSNGDEAAKTLTNSLHLIVPGQGHNVIYRGCIPKIAADFVESGSLQGLNTACSQDIRPMPFFLNFSGPVP